MKLNYYGMLYVKKRVFKTLHILLQEARVVIKQAHQKEID